MLDSFFDLVQDNAKCHNHPEPDKFFDYPLDGTRPEILKFCGDCKIRVECFDYAIERDLYGVWAGTTRRERLAIQKHYNIQPLTLTKEIGIRV